MAKNKKGVIKIKFLNGLFSIIKGVFRDLKKLYYFKTKTVVGFTQVLYCEGDTIQIKDGEEVERVRILAIDHYKGQMAVEKVSENEDRW